MMCCWFKFVALFMYVTEFITYCSITLRSLQVYQSLWRLMRCLTRGVKGRDAQGGMQLVLSPFRCTLPQVANTSEPHPKDFATSGWRGFYNDDFLPLSQVHSTLSVNIRNVDISSCGWRLRLLLFQKMITRVINDISKTFLRTTWVSQTTKLVLL